MKRDFDLIQAIFWLVALVVAVVMLVLLVSSLACVWEVVKGDIAPATSCRSLGDVIRQWWVELLATIMALLAASNGRRPPGPGGGDVQKTP